MTGIEPLRSGMHVRVDDRGQVWNVESGAWCALTAGIAPGLYTTTRSGPLGPVTFTPDTTTAEELAANPDTWRNRYGMVVLVNAPADAQPTDLEVQQGACPDCLPNITMRWCGPNEPRWTYEVAHDDECPWLAAHEGGN